MSPKRPTGPGAVESSAVSAPNGPAVDDTDEEESGTEAPRGRWSRRSIHIPLPLPRTFQGRLSLAFVIVFAVAVGIVSGVTLFVLDRDLRQQDEVSLEARANAVGAVLGVQAEDIASRDTENQTVVSAGGFSVAPFPGRTTLATKRPIVMATSVFVARNNVTRYATWINSPDAQNSRAPAVRVQDYPLWRDFELSLIDTGQSYVNGGTFVQLSTSAILVQIHRDPAFLHAVYVDTHRLPE